MSNSLQARIDDVAPGSSGRFTIPVGQLASGTPVDIPCLIVRGSQTGPVLWINGQVHGDEINGVVAGLRFVDDVQPSLLNGAIIVSSTSNPLAFDHRSKKAPQDDVDLDQSYPGSQNGQTTDRMAAAFFAMACEADLLVNMHTMGTPFDSEPYAVYKVHPDGPQEKDLLRLVRWFEPAVACRMSVAGGTGELPGNLTGALDYQMLKRGKTAFMVELGGGGRIDERHVAQGLAGLRGLAADLGMLPPDPARRAPAALLRVTKRRHVMCSGAGIFHALHRAGSILKAGDPLGRIVNLFGDTVETPRFEEDVFVIGVRREPVVHTGDRIAFVATEWNETAV